MTTIRQIINEQEERSKWSLYDEASHRGGNYADFWIAETKELMRDEGMTLHSVMKQAYLQGFIHGFEHKFDQTNYEEKNDD